MVAAKGNRELGSSLWILDLKESLGKLTGVRNSPLLVIGETNPVEESLPPPEVTEESVPAPPSTPSPSKPSKVAQKQAKDDLLWHMRTGHIGSARQSLLASDKIPRTAAPAGCTVCY